MKDLFEDVQRIRKYYADLDRQLARDGKHIFITGSKDATGVFLANSVDIFVDIITAGIMRQRKTRELSDLEGLKIMDAGCGDSRSLAIGSLFGFDCYGLDLEEYLISVSRDASETLYQQRIIPSQFKVAQGNYLADQSYRQLGIDFQDVDYFLHRLNSLTVFDLIAKFAEQSKQGANLVLIGGPGVIEFREDALQNGLSFSRVYVAREETRVQNCYVFLSKH